MKLSLFESLFLIHVFFISNLLSISYIMTLMRMDFCFVFYLLYIIFIYIVRV